MADLGTTVRAIAEKIAQPHTPTIQTGYEIHDRQVFISELLSLLDYSADNLLIDVSQKVDGATKTPDIRLYGNNELLHKDTHAQFVIETKNFGWYRSNQVGLLQLKRYIIANRSRIRLIAATDYQEIHIFNASMIRMDGRFQMRKLDAIGKLEVDLFREARLAVVDLARMSSTDVKYLTYLSHRTVFEHQKFNNPQDASGSSDVADGDVRTSFVIQLFDTARIAESQLTTTFESSLKPLLTTLNKHTDADSTRLALTTFLNGPGGPRVRSFFLWGIEMNYLAPQLASPRDGHQFIALSNYLLDADKREAFVLASTYSLVNKCFFLRALEDAQTQSTRFLNGEIGNRYLSNGILQQKYAEGEQVLIGYIRQLFNFDYPDLTRYSFLLRRDLFSWVLDALDPQSLLRLLRLFNDIYLKNLNQDILGDIYEHYLERSRPDGEKSYRQLLGQYYTPKPIVRLMWQLSRDVMKREWNSDLHEFAASGRRILDPCYGSGTFLCEAVLQANAAEKRKRISKDGRVFGFMKDRGPQHRLEDTLVGLELNPLSKGIADVNLFLSLVQAYGPATIAEFPVERINLFRTNSLDVSRDNQATPQNEDTLFLFSDELKRAMEDSRAIRAAKGARYDLVIANPPYAYADDAALHNKRLIPFAIPAMNFNDDGTEVDFDWERAERGGKVPAKEKNRGKLTDLYALFFGGADLLLKDGGLVTFITSNTWLAIPTYKFFRKYYLKNYTIHYIVNFNNISDRVSVFAPDAGVATCLVVMTKTPPGPHHKLRYLNLAQRPSIREKFDAIADIEWTGRGVDRRDIRKFEVRGTESLPWREIPQASFLDRPDYMLRISESDDIVAKMETDCARLSEQMSSHQGVDVGDLKNLVATSRTVLRSKIVNLVFKGELSSFGKTARGYIEAGLKSGKINCTYDPKREHRLVYQKHLERYRVNKTHWTYMDHYILWRSRMKRGKVPSTAIFQPTKLFVLERREQNRILAVVTDQLMVPQHGGRFFYFVADERVSEDLLHATAAILNSRLLSWYYKVAAQGNKDINLTRIQQLPGDVVDRLAGLSREIHALYRDLQRASLGHEGFETALMQQAAQDIRSLPLLESGKWWSVEYDGGTMLDCVVDGPVRLDGHPNTVVLNAQTRLVCVSNEVATALLNGPLNAYQGDVLQDELMVRPSQIDGDIQSLDSVVEAAVARLMAVVDDIVEGIYDLTEADRAVVANAVGVGLV